MIKLMITAASSNSGKTAITCGLLSLLERKGFDPCAFKCGPDYIDPMFHRSVMGIQSTNLDVFLAGEDGIRQIFASGSRGHDAAVCEGVMGYYDGRMPGSAEGSAWHVADLLDMPAILVVRPKGSALTLAAVIKGLSEFKTPGRICGVIFNDCSEMFYQTYAASIESQSGVPVLGYLPHMEEAGFESRHLGLMTAGEIDDLADRIVSIGYMMDETIDLERLISIAGWSDGPAQAGAAPSPDPDAVHAKRAAAPVKIAVAQDQAFSFIYDETLTALAQAGADIEYFSPLSDEAIPAGACGLYLPGGYPELYAGELAKNTRMLESIREAVSSGMPTIAECGGFLYLSDALEDTEGKSWKMAGVLPGSAADTGKLVRFGYGYISSGEDTMLIKKDEQIPVHEFHYWDSTDTGCDMHFVKANGSRNWDFGFTSDTLYAGFPHLYPAGFGGKLAKRFVEAAAKFETEKAEAEA
ncbi:MAG: cobyrinate a,c-diamide synthase [Bacillota bacterium]|nr:cobyrinate a,c-diamide synthase [Bacillota bacterium]